MNANAEYSNKRDRVIAFFKNLPGIKLVDASFAKEFYDFINTNYTEKIKIEYDPKTGYKSNFQILFAEIKETENYKKITKEILDYIIKQVYETICKNFFKELECLSENLKNTYLDKVASELNEDATHYFKYLEGEYARYDAVNENEPIKLSVDLWLKSENHFNKYRQRFLDVIYLNEFSEILSRNQEFKKKFNESVQAISLLKNDEIEANIKVHIPNFLKNIIENEEELDPNIFKNFINPDDLLDLTPNLVEAFYEAHKKNFEDILIDRYTDTKYLNEHEIKEIVKKLLEPYIVCCIRQNKKPEFNESCNEFAAIKKIIKSPLDIQLPQMIDSFYEENKVILNTLFAKILPHSENLLKESISKYTVICKERLIKPKVDNFKQWLPTVAFEPGFQKRRLDSFIEEYENLDANLILNLSNKIACFYNEHQKGLDEFFEKRFNEEYKNLDISNKEDITKKILIIFTSICPDENNIITIDNFKLWLNFYSSLNLKELLEGYIAKSNKEISVTPFQTISLKKLDVLYKNNSEILNQYFSEEVFLKESKFLDGAAKEKIIKKIISTYISKDIDFPIESVLNWHKTRTKDNAIETFEKWANVFRNNTNNKDSIEWYAELKRIVNSKKLEILRNNFKYLHLKSPSDKDLEKLFFIFEDPINNLYTNIKTLINIFDDIHRNGDTGVTDLNFEIRTKKHIENCLSYLKQSSIQNAEVRKVAYSQAILHRFGFLADSHGSIGTETLNAALTVDHKEIAASIRNFFHSILLPLQPLAKEWFVLIPSEKNWLIIGLRLLIPILIASVIIALGFLLISFIVSMPAVFELLMIIPLTYFGFFAASMCIVMRDYTYESFMNFMYSGQYNRPIYQVNQNLKEKFGEDLAIKIRDYYVDELKDSELLRKQILSISQDSNKMCNEENLEELANSASRKEQLSAEWSVLTGHQQPEEIAFDELTKKVKERIMLDAKTIAGLSSKKVSYKQERDNYITSYCQKISNCQNYSFFHNAPLTKSKKQYEKLEQLREINSGLENISPSV